MRPMSVACSPSETPSPALRRPGGSAVRLQRSRGVARLGVARSGAASRPVRLWEEGCLRLRCMRRAVDTPEVVLIDTAGGLTAGDRLAVDVRLGAGAAATVTSVAMEKIYRSPAGEARIATILRLGPRAGLAWLPQETILFDGARLVRHTRLHLAADSRLLWCEGLIFGRLARGERIRSGLLHERVDLRVGGRLLHADRLRLEGEIDGLLARPAVGGGARAVGTALLHLPDPELAEAALGSWRVALDGLGIPVGGGASRTAGLVRARLLAADGAALRTALAALVAAGRPWLGGPPQVPRSWDL